MSYKYAPGPNGLKFCFATRPTFECSLEDAVVKESEGGPWTPRPEVVAMAEAAGCDPVLLGRQLRHAHQRNRGSRHREGGRLTERCGTCGRPMRRLGFRVWVERPWAEGDEQTSHQVISMRLLGGGTVRERETYVDTKREAYEWAFDEQRAARREALEAKG